MHAGQQGAEPQPAPSTRCCTGPWGNQQAGFEVAVFNSKKDLNCSIIGAPICHRGRGMRNLAMPKKAAPASGVGACVACMGVGLVDCTHNYLGLVCRLLVAGRQWQDNVVRSSLIAAYGNVARSRRLTCLGVLTMFSDAQKLLDCLCPANFPPPHLCPIQNVVMNLQ